MKKTMLLFSAAVIAGLVSITSCSKSNEEDLSSGGNPTGCDTVNMQYSADVLPVLQNNCYGCHGNGGAAGGVNLDDYDHVKIQADNGALIGTITHASGYVPMPLNLPQLSDCDINKIMSWINNGALNN